MWQMLHRKFILDFINLLEFQQTRPFHFSGSFFANAYKNTFQFLTFREY